MTDEQLNRLCETAVLIAVIVMIGLSRADWRRK